ncbi:IS256 family transposase [Rhabdothermincola sediminis]|uniref:IS256 family transposase n=1 Tax=Rhabdothermincola sediminis TaxID=2751370 RepID=UPI0035581969
MTDHDLSELLAARKAGEVTGTIRASLEWILQQLIEVEATAFIGAAPFERTETRTAQRNGRRPRLLSTPAGDVELEIPKLRQGSFLPSLLERRRRIDRALYAVVMEAYVHGVSTRKVDDLVKALGVGSGISKSEVSRICSQLDRDLEAFRDRPLDHTEFVYVFLDATYVKGRVGGRVVSRAVVIATSVTATGDREVLGIDVGDSEDGALWTAFLKGLRARGLTGVQLVISDHHLGLKSAIGAMLVGAAWQRCRVHFMRNVLSRVPKASAEMVAAAIRTVFAQPDAAHARSQLDEVARMLAAKFPDVAAMLRDAAEDLLAFTGFPVAHRRKIRSTNPLERINGEIKRRTNVVGIFPNDATVVQLVTAVLVETHDECAVAERRHLSEQSMAKTGKPVPTIEEAPLTITA